MAEDHMISTFQALWVSVIAILPGALYIFSYERVVGSYGMALGDRIIRFLGASAVLHSLLSGCTYWTYSRWVSSGRLANGEIRPLYVEFLSLAYVIIPVAAGSLVGVGRERGWRWAVLLSGSAPEPRAWDYVWRRHKVSVVRIRMKSGRWLAGVFGTFEDAKQSYASGYPEVGDFYLARMIEVDASSGEFAIGPDGGFLYPSHQPGLLVKWEEVEYIEHTEQPS